MPLHLNIKFIYSILDSVQVNITINTEETKVSPLKLSCEEDRLNIELRLKDPAIRDSAEIYP